MTNGWTELYEEHQKMRLENATLNTEIIVQDLIIASLIAKLMPKGAADIAAKVNELKKAVRREVIKAKNK